MPAYFASDVHLRPDRPDRGHRFARLVGRLGPDEPLTIVGDLCDFWFSSRQAGDDPRNDPGLRALLDYQDRGGRAEVLLGNHDLWLGPYYERLLGRPVRPEPWEVEVHGLRLHLAHGHRVGGTAPWKRLMESRLFLEGFRRVPAPVANALEFRLDRTNSRRRAAAERRMLAAYRRYADRLAGAADLVVLGHVHRRVDDASGPPRLVVLGDWLEGGSYLRVDDSGARAFGAAD